MKPFYFSKNYAIINLATGICNTPAKIIVSDLFLKVLQRFVSHVRKHDFELFTRIRPLSIDEILAIYKFLLVWEFEKIANYFPNADLILAKRRALYRFSEQFYDYWRSISRYGWILKRHQIDDEQTAITQATESFNATVLALYRTVTQRLRVNEVRVLRQLPAGVNANMILTHNNWRSADVYKKLHDTLFISCVLMRPPFIIGTKANTRNGLFQEIFENPLAAINYKPRDFFCYPVWVGPFLTYVFFHRDFIHHGIALSSLFESAGASQFNCRKPDLIYIYGIQEHEYDATYYHDDKEGVYIGFVARNDQNDYFGYMKKMLLTLHNIAQIDRGNLPIHGSMVTIELYNRRTWKVVIIGDSGAGKSESLEALRVIGEKYVRDIRIVFDDMGTFFLKDGQVLAQGTEIGAFVRLDDLEVGYAYREMDRAIFMNPNKINARIILPISTYEYIMKEHQIDMVFYANNYDDNNAGLCFFSSMDEALPTFMRGRRKAKGTTSETGIVESFFANPFGPMQKQSVTQKLLESYFAHLFNNGVKVGELYTRLGIDGFESSGPLYAAKCLLEYLTK